MFDDTPLPFDNSPTPPPQNNEGEISNMKKQPTPSVDHQTGEIIPPKKQTQTKEGTPPPASQPKAPLANPFQILLKEKQNALKNFLGNDENALVFMSSVMHSLEKVPELYNCDQKSLLTAFMECAAIGLYPGNASGDCYVLPYKGKAQFQLGYKGVKTLAYASGVLRIWAEVVYEKDYFKQRLGSDPKIEHEPASDDERGDAIGAYACAEVTPGNIVFKYLPKSKIMKIKESSPSAGSPYSPWNKVDPDLWMWKKCAVKQLGKLMPQTPRMKRAIHLDNVSERGGYFEADGSLFEQPFGPTQDQIINQGKAKKETLRKSKKK